MSKGSFGLSVMADRGLVLQPAVGRTPGVLFLVLGEAVKKLELTDAVVTPHREGLRIPLSEADKSSSNGALNYAFVNETVRAAVESNSYTLGDTNVVFKYTITGVDYSASFEGFREGSIIDLMRVLTKELHKQYDAVSDMVKTAREKGIELELESSATDFDIAEQMRKKQITAKYFSSVRPGVRSASVKKGFS